MFERSEMSVPQHVTFGTKISDFTVGTLSHLDERSEDYDGEAGVCLRWHRGYGNLLQPVTGRAKRGSDGRSPSLYILIELGCLYVCLSVCLCKVVF